MMLIIFSYSNVDCGTWWRNIIHDWPARVYVTYSCPCWFKWPHSKVVIFTALQTSLTQERYGNKETLELNLEKLRRGLQSSTLAELYWRLGWEAGRILAIIHKVDNFLFGCIFLTRLQERISWGTYPDKLGIHCNAHPNNLVLLDKGDYFLAPLDFDMAFTEQSVTSLTYVDSFR